MDEYQVFPILIVFMIGALTALAYTLRRMGPIRETSGETYCQQCGRSSAGLVLCAQCRTANAVMLANGLGTVIPMVGELAEASTRTDCRRLATPTE